jgi:hypothetical protein
MNRIYEEHMQHNYEKKRKMDYIFIFISIVNYTNENYVRDRI